MRPLLVSIALLLLALCRTSDALEEYLWGQTMTAGDSAVTFSKATKDVEAAKLIARYTPEFRMRNVELFFGNTVHALLLKGAGKFDALPDYYKKALVNGVLCEIEYGKVKKMAYVLYPLGKGWSPAVIPEQQKLAKTYHGIDCNVTTKADPCVCTPARLNHDDDWDKPLIYCLAKKHFTGTHGICLDDALSALRNAGMKRLAKRIYVDASGGAFDSRPPTIDSVTRNESSEHAQLLCEAADPASEPLVAAVYASDGLAWTRDIPLRKTLGGPVDEVCAADKVASANAIDKCVCENKMAADICVAKFQGAAMKASNYLNCSTNPPTYKADAKDEAYSAVLEAMGMQRPTSPDIPTTTPRPIPQPTRQPVPAPAPNDGKDAAAAYLDCGATAKFDETKKDAAVAAIGKMMGGGGAPQPGPGPAPGGPTAAPPAGGNETTTAATGGGAATSSSLLLAPLAAAAAAVLLL